MKALLDSSSESDGCETPGTDGSAYDPNNTCDSDDITASEATVQPIHSPQPHNLRLPHQQFPHPHTLSAYTHATVHVSDTEPTILT